VMSATLQLPIKTSFHCQAALKKLARISSTLKREAHHILAPRLVCSTQKYKNPR
jgi:hypothetical protein